MTRTNYDEYRVFDSDPTRPPRRINKKRRCMHPCCNTILNPYNRGKLCYMHNRKYRQARLDVTYTLTMKVWLEDERKNEGGKYERKSISNNV